MSSCWCWFQRCYILIWSLYAAHKNITSSTIGSQWPNFRTVCHSCFMFHIYSNLTVPFSRRQAMLLSQNQSQSQSPHHSGGGMHPPPPGSSAGVDDSSDEDEKVDVGGAADLQASVASLSCGKDGKYQTPICLFLFSITIMMRMMIVIIVINNSNNSNKKPKHL